jgi:phytoene dehydrogenase-like protein
MAGRDAVVVGAGPNGLAAAITLARQGRSVTVFEAAETIGGGTRSAELTLPGFIHDVCSAVHPLGVGSPFFRSVPLDKFGLEWIHPPAPLAHPFDDGTAALMERSITDTANTFGADEMAYHQLMEPLAAECDKLLEGLLQPLILPRRPFQLARFGLNGMRSARSLAERQFTGRRARGLFAGLAAHSILSLDAPFSASFGLTLGMLGHAVGWPIPAGGSQRIADAMAAYLKSLGGEIITGQSIQSADQLPETRAIFFDLGPNQLLRIMRGRLHAGYKRRLERYRYGPGVFKVDWALDGPIPWKAAACARAGTVHLGGTLDDIAAGEAAVAEGRHPDRPFVLLAQPSLFDPSRAPAGKHTAWAYCHVPNGSTVNMLNRVERQVERFAPGFLGRVLARHVAPPAWLERHNANNVGGDITGGSNDAWQLLGRPRFFSPYKVPTTRGPKAYICSASTPPGGGVHGMCGYNAARNAR